MSNLRGRLSKLERRPEVVNDCGYCGPGGKLEKEADKRAACHQADGDKFAAELAEIERIEGAVKARFGDRPRGRATCPRCERDLGEGFAWLEVATDAELALLDLLQDFVFDCKPGLTYANPSLDARIRYVREAVAAGRPRVHWPGYVVDGVPTPCPSYWRS